MAASPDWRTWFPAPAWLPRDPKAACDAAWRHLQASGVALTEARGGTHFEASEGPAAGKEGVAASVRIEFQSDGDGNLRLRYRPTSGRRSWLARWFPFVGFPFSTIRENAARWDLALRVDRLLRSKKES